MGMTPAQWQASRPALLPENIKVFDVWGFCEGWNPDRVEMAAVFYGVSDLGFLIEQLMLMRDTIEKWQKARREAGNGKRR